MFATPVYLNDFHHFVDLKNQTDPLQWTTNIVILNLTDYDSIGVTYNLDQNELTLNDGKIGIFQAEPDPITFLSTASIDKDINTKPPKTDSNGNIYPRVEVTVQMTNVKLVHKREAYTVFNILEDFGGFSGSIVMVFSFLMSFYSERVY